MAAAEIGSFPPGVKRFFLLGAPIIALIIFGYFRTLIRISITKSFLLILTPKLVWPSWFGWSFGGFLNRFRFR